MLKNRLVRGLVAAAAVAAVAFSSGATASAGTDYPPNTEPPAERSLETSFDSACLEGVPYVQFSVTPVGFTPDGPVTITVRDVNGNVVDTFIFDSLSGQFLYSGANSAGTVLPGWLLIDGEWVPDSTNEILRQGLFFEVEVNPTATGTAAYPPATTTCADPTQGGDPGADEPGDPADPSAAGVLPSTGSNATMIILLAGAGLLGAGIVTSVAMRRRHAGVDIS